VVMKCAMGTLEERLLEEADSAQDEAVAAAEAKAAKEAEVGEVKRTSSRLHFSRRMASKGSEKSRRGKCKGHKNMRLRFVVEICVCRRGSPRRWPRRRRRRRRSGRRRWRRSGRTWRACPRLSTRRSRRSRRRTSASPSPRWVFRAVGGGANSLSGFLLLFVPLNSCRVYG